MTGGMVGTFLAHRPEAPDGEQWLIEAYADGLVTYSTRPAPDTSIVWSAPTVLAHPAGPPAPPVGPVMAPATSPGDDFERQVAAVCATLRDTMAHIADSLDTIAADIAAARSTHIEAIFDAGQLAGQVRTAMPPRRGDLRGRRS